MAADEPELLRAIIDAPDDDDEPSHARALVRKVTLTLDVFAAHAGWILDRFPVRTFELIALSSAEIRRLAASPVLARAPGLGRDGLRALATAPGMTRCARVSPTDATLRGAGAAAIATSPGSRALRRLRLPRCEIHGRGASALTESPYLTQLATIDLGLQRRY